MISTMFFLVLDNEDGLLLFHQFSFSCLSFCAVRRAWDLEDAADGLRIFDLAAHHACEHVGKRRAVKL